MAPTRDVRAPDASEHVTSDAPIVPAAAPAFDALLPPAMARRGVEVGVRKAVSPAVTTFGLAVLAGAFIAVGAVFATTVGAGGSAVTGADGTALATANLPFGIGRLLSGVAFSLGLILVVVAGAELFTGNVLIVMAWLSGRVSTARMLRNWGIVYAGNLVGALATVALVVVGGWYRLGGGAVGVAALATADAKVAHGFAEAVALGILCNALVCLAVWLTYSARTTTDKVLAIVPPIAAFVACGFEHSIANLFFIPMGIAIRAFAAAEFWAAAHTSAAAHPTLDLAGFLGNLAPVTLGNIVGGAVLVGAMYWIVYLRDSRAPRAATLG